VVFLFDAEETLRLSALLALLGRQAAPEYGYHFHLSCEPLPKDTIQSLLIASPLKVVNPDRQEPFLFSVVEPDGRARDQPRLVGGSYEQVDVPALLTSLHHDGLFLSLADALLQHA